MRAMNAKKTATRADNALNFMVTAELKEALQATARRCGVNVTDLVRLSLRAMLPVFDSLAESREMLITELFTSEKRRLRKRHIGIDDEE
jgi:hypothetical protein